MNHESILSRPPNFAQFRFACVHCRKMIRKPMPRSCFPGIMHKPVGPPCAECGTTLIRMLVGKYFEPPRRNDLKAWKQLELAYFEPDSYRDATGKLRAKMPREVARQRQQETQQRLLRGAKGDKCRQRRQKRGPPVAGTVLHYLTLSSLTIGDQAVQAVGRESVLPGSGATTKFPGSLIKTKSIETPLCIMHGIGSTMRMQTAGWQCQRGEL